MVNIAYLLLVHNQPSQLARLVNRLNQPNAYFFIHIDKKSIDKAAFKERLAGFANVKVISEYEVNWMGFHMVQATIALMQLAVSSGVEFKYVALMSGQDYPIKNNDYINRFFSEHNEDFISFARINDSPEMYKNKVRYYHFYDVPYINPRSNKKVPFLVYLYFGIQKRAMNFMPKRAFYRNYEPYFGSQWFVLRQDTVAYILKFTAENKGYPEFMKYTEGPDETFFHTILLNSDRAANVYGFDAYQEWRKTMKPGDHFIQGYSSLRYMDWSDRGKDETKPAVLDETYFETLKNDSDLFARKFDERRSAPLMDLIDEHLLNIKPAK